jgi:hypothetical protein
MNDPQTLPQPSSDDWLVANLSSMFEVTEPVPEDALAAAYAAFGLGDLDQQLAALVFDSLATAGAPAMRSADTDVRLLSFVNDNMTLDVELHADGRTVVGQLTPPAGPEATVETEGGDEVTLDIDAFGRFRVSIDEGRIIRFRVPGQLVTPWITR